MRVFSQIFNYLGVNQKMEKPNKKEYIQVLQNTAQGQRKLGDWVGSNIGECQSMLIEELLSKGYEVGAIEGFCHDDIENLYRTFDPAENITKATCPDCEEEVEEVDAFTEQCADCYENNREAQEIFEWWVVDSWTASKLKDQGEPILDNDYGIWWGRTTTGQAIKMDYVIACIVADLNFEYWNEEDQAEFEAMKGDLK